jgi:hypothetical protein
MTPMTSDELFMRLLALDHSRLPPWGPLHGVVVACHVLQQAEGPIAVDDPRMQLLRTFLDGGQPAVDAMTAGARRRNSHRARGSVHPSPAGPLLAGPPRSFATTIADVAVDGTFPVDGYESRVRAWADATLRGWTGGVS